MKEKIFSVLRILLFLAIGILLFWLAIKDQNIGLIKKNLEQADWKWAALALVFGFISNIFRAARWNMLIHPLGYRPKLINSFGAVFIGYMANLALPRLGEVTRCAVLSRYEKTPINKLFGTVVTERIIDVLTIFLLLLVVVLLEFDKMSAFSVQYVFAPLGEKFNALFSHGVMFYIIAVGAFAAFFFLSWFVFLRIRRTRSYVKLRYIIRGFVVGIKTVSKLQSRNLFLLYTVLIWGMYLIMSYSCFWCFHATSNLGFVAALAVMVFGGFGWAAPVQGGFGTYHIIIKKSLVLFGVMEDDGLAYAILSHATQVFGMLTFGLLFLVVLPVINRKAAVKMEKTES
ncbi:MAG TPA: lysylphosphatidylglycerol synthase transmembrane domain-containing protein [Chitinophagales bacterium]|nr:lysylphosphatidylglycerol synthase transmembrane domain-containing protein [Chitinophagales bacterium]